MLHLLLARVSGLEIDAKNTWQVSLKQFTFQYFYDFIEAQFFAFSYCIVDNS